MLSFQAEQPPLAGFRRAAALYQVVIAGYLGLDKAPFHIGMDFTGCPFSRAMLLTEAPISV